ncbi:MAG: TetR/AcrR family transcriptional regulator [Marinobacterium sp.]|nr:TetR/AcrR family transcriptional regulator [Marinobacterium sp.]
MANPAKFQRHEVVNKSMQLFWQKGFHATSMRDLQQHVDLRPGSLYATFGSKEGLFREALDCYATRGEQRLQGLLDEHESALSALEQFFYQAVIAQADSAPSRVCMLARAVAELDDERPELLDYARRQLLRMEHAFAAALYRAHAQGELAVCYEPDTLATFLQMQMMGLRSWSRLHDDLARAEAMLREVFRPLRA